jgi:origin recognition complex subunit 2
MDQVEVIENKYRSEFGKWRFLLSTNHSLLFYGAGSKRELLNSFARDELYKEGESLVIDGTDKDVTVTGILDILVQLYLNGTEPHELFSIKCRPENVPVTGKCCPLKAPPVVERAIMVGRGLAHAVEESEKPLPPKFLIIHSRDARLTSSRDQEALAMLVINSTVSNGVAALRIVASVDHVDAPTFLWTPVTEANFAWFPCCVHTHRPFLQELDLVEEDGAQKKQAQRESRTSTQAQRILDVLQNLAPRHTEVVQLLARLQVNKNDWVDYFKYRERCKSACAINKDSQLRALLRELMDHGLVVSRTEGSKEMVRIPFDLQEIIEFQRS